LLLGWGGTEDLLDIPTHVHLVKHP
jgi:hypothetical protein